MRYYSRGNIAWQLIGGIFEPDRLGLYLNFTTYYLWDCGLLCLVAQSCPILCNPMDCNPSGSSVHGILQARILEWVAMPSFRGSSQPRDWIQVSLIAGRFLSIWATREAHFYSAAAKSLQSCPTLCNPMDYRLPGSSVHGILQARILECVAMYSSRGSSQPRDRTWVSHIAGRFFTTGLPGKPSSNTLYLFFKLIVE